MAFFQRAVMHITISKKLNISRTRAIHNALSKAGLFRWEVFDLEADLDFQGSGGYPCYTISFTYRDENDQEIRMRCAVDGQTGEFLEMKQID